MEHLELWKLATDIGLCFSLIILCWRFLRSPESALVSRRTLELESALKALVQEADAASKSLHEKLTRRQQALEKLLFDLGTVEARVNRAITTADEEKHILTQAVSEARKLAEEARYDASTASRRTEREPGRGESAAPARQAAAALAKEIEVESQESRPSSRAGRGVNIFGEEVGSSSQAMDEAKPAEPSIPARGIKAYGGLSASVEKISEPAPKRAEQAKTERSAGQKTLEDIYKNAEQMLAAGKDLQTISTSLRLPIDQVRLLMEIMASEADDAEIPATTSDPRLGALSKPETASAAKELPVIKRQVQVL